MTAVSVPAVAAVVVGSRGGARLARSLESVRWAGERIVLDPAGRLAAMPLPDGVRRVSELAMATTAPWLLLLEEQETVLPSFAPAVVAAIARPDGPRAYRVAQEVTVDGATFRLPGAPVRLVRRVGSDVVLRFRLGVELRSPGGPAPVLGVPLAVAASDTLAAAVEDLDADTASIAAILAARGVRPRLWYLAVLPLVAAARALVAAGGGGGFETRAALVVFGAYRTLLAYAKLWELRRVAGAAYP